MSTYIKPIEDKDGNTVLPITNPKAVYDDNGNRLDNTLSNLTNLVNNKASANLVSDAYNPSKTYAQGEFCIYNNTLWKSKVANNLGNTPTEGSYWTATNVGNELNKDFEKYSWSDVAITSNRSITFPANGLYVITYRLMPNTFVNFKLNDNTLCTIQNGNTGGEFMNAITLFANANEVITMDSNNFDNFAIDRITLQKIRL